MILWFIKTTVESSFVVQDIQSILYPVLKLFLQSLFSLHSHGILPCFILRLRAIRRLLLSLFVFLLLPFPPLLTLQLLRYSPSLLLLKRCSSARS